MQGLTKLVGDQECHHLRVDMNQGPDGRGGVARASNLTILAQALLARDGEDQACVRATQEVRTVIARVQTQIEFGGPPFRIEIARQLNDIDPIRVDAKIRELTQELGTDIGPISTGKVGDSQEGGPHRRHHQSLQTMFVISMS